MNLDQIKAKLVSQDGKYLGAFNYIVNHKPKFIVEYGRGETTFYLTELVNFLDYGGVVRGYESDKFWFEDHVANGWNMYNNIYNVDIEHVQYLDKKNLYVVRYLHSLEEVKDVDFVIIDGPNLTSFDPYPIATINLLDIISYIGREIPYFIDGRSGTSKFYRARLKQNLEVKDLKNTNI